MRCGASAPAEALGGIFRDRPADPHKSIGLLTQVQLVAQIPIPVLIAAILIGALVQQFGQKRYVLWSYWLAAVLILIVGTLVADNHRQFLRLGGDDHNRLFRRPRRDLRGLVFERANTLNS